MASFISSRTLSVSSLFIVMHLFIASNAPLQADKLFHQTFAPQFHTKAQAANDTPSEPNTPDLNVRLALNSENTLADSSSSNAWPSDDHAFSMLSHAERKEVWGYIKEARKERDRPTERGLWFDRRSREDRMARMASDAQYPTILTQGLSMYDQGQAGQEDAKRGAKALLATGAVTILIKKTLRRRRPYPNDHKFGSFPSGHTSTVFAMAAVFSSAQPQQRLMALGAASIVGWSRVKVRAHHWDDVLVGAALGYAIGRHFAPDKATPRRQNYPVASVQFTF